MRSILIQICNAMAMANSHFKVLRRNAPFGVFFIGELLAYNFLQRSILQWRWYVSELTSFDFGILVQSRFKNIKRRLWIPKL